MRGFHALFIVILISSSVLFATQTDELGNNINTNHKISRQTPQRHQADWDFILDPVEIFETHRETYSHPNGTPAQVQDIDARFFLFHAEEPFGMISREYLAYLNPDGTLCNISYASQEYQPEGIGGMAMDPETQDPIYVWECYRDDNPYPDIMLGSDVWHLLHSPGLISTPITIFDQNDPDEFPEFQATEKHFYRNPDILITRAPSYFEDFKRRLYVIAYQPYSDDISPIAIAYCDFDTINLETGTLVELDWNYITDFPIENYGDQPKIKTHFAAACHEDGIVGIVGWKEGSWNDLPPEDSEFFVLYNDNFGEGEWEYHETNLEMYVESPVNQSGLPWLQVAEQLHFAPVNAGNFSAVCNYYGALHVAMPYSLRGIYWGEPTVWPLLSQVRNVCFNAMTGEFESYEVYPQSDLPQANEPYLPWDEDKDGQVDQYDPETGHVVPVCSLPWQHWDMRYARHRNSIKTVTSADNYQHEHVCIWMDALNSYRAHLEGEYAPPDMMIGGSPHAGFSWFEPIVLSPDPDNANGDFTEQIDGQIPNTPILSSKLLDLGDSYSKLSIFYLDEFEHGPSGDWGGIMRYMELDASFAILCTCSVKNDLIPVREFGNHPNPFNPSTTIRYDLPKGSHVTIEVFNARGQKVRTLMNGVGKTGMNSVVWNGDDDSGKPVSSGVYLYRLETERKTITKKMLLLE